MAEAYVCMRVNHGNRLGGCEETVEDVAVYKRPEDAVDWLLAETLIDRDPKTDDDLYFVDQKPPMEHGSLNQDIALKMLAQNGSVRIVIFDAYEENYDSFTESIIKKAFMF